MQGRRHLGLVIHGNQAQNETLRALVTRLREAGHDVSPRLTWERGDAERYARDLAAAGADTVIAAGGDGTVNAVVNGLRGSATALGILPLGTANDFARQAGIPEELEAALGTVLDGAATRIDTASLNGRRFLNVSTAGFGAEAVAEATPESKRALGTFAYLVSSLKKLSELTPYHARFEADDWSLETDFFLFAVGNARATGGGRPLTPQASVRDGLLDLCVIDKMPAFDLARVALALRNGEHVEAPGVHYVQHARLRVTAREPILVNADGESNEYAELEYAAEPESLCVYLPRVTETPLR